MRVSSRARARLPARRPRATRRATPSSARPSVARRASAAPRDDRAPPLKAVSFILCRPEGAINVGAAARAMHNFGVEDLCLVSPLCVDANGALDGEAEKFAVHGKRLLTASGRAADAGTATADATLVVATTARPRENLPLLGLREGAERIAREVAAGGRVAVLFGNERSGLANEELELAEFAVCVPTAANVDARVGKYTGGAGANSGVIDASPMSLNLGAAVGVIAYELFMAITQARGDDVNIRGFESHRMTTKERQVLIDDVLEARRSLDFFPDDTNEEDVLFADKERRSITAVFSAGPIATKDATPLFMLARRARAFARLANAETLIVREARAFARASVGPVSAKEFNNLVRDKFGLSLTRRELERALERAADAP